MASGCYVYAILGSEVSVPSSVAGFGGSPLCRVYWRSLAAATCYVESAELCPTPENALSHEAIVEALRLSGRVLPVRFGTILADSGAVVRAIRERYDVLLADLVRLGDKVELGLTVLWGADEVGGEEQRVREGPADLATQTEMGRGARYLAAKMAEYRQEQVLHSRARSLARRLDGALRRHTLESHITLVPTPRLALRATYLLAPSQVGVFHRAFDEVRRQSPDLRFLLSGPWPPYSFVTPPLVPSPTAQSGLRDLLRAPVAISSSGVGPNTVQMEEQV